MKSKFISLIIQKKELLVLLISVLLCLIAINNPVVKLKKSITSYMLLVDVSQSMNAKDLTYMDKKISRMEYTKVLLKKLSTLLNVEVFLASIYLLLIMLPL